MRKAIIYKITNTANGKSYIGVSVQPQIRILQHLFCRKQGSEQIRHALLKYPLDCFEFNALLIGSEDYCYALEDVCINAFDCLVPNGYNLSKGGFGGSLPGRKHTEESKRKNSKSCMGRVPWNKGLRYEDWRKENFYGKPSKYKDIPRPPEIGAKIKAALALRKGVPSKLIGLKRSAEFGQKISKTKIANGGDPKRKAVLTPLTLNSLRRSKPKKLKN